MKKKGYIYLAGFLLVCSCHYTDWERSYFRVKAVKNGNQLVLVNGYQIKLAGIKGSEEAQNYMEKNVKGKKVRFTFDSSTGKPINKSTSYAAYVHLKTKKDRKFCINTYFLREKISELDSEHMIKDSLEIYRKYADIQKIGK